MACIDAKYGIGVFGISIYGRLCPSTGKIYIDTAGVFKKKLDPFDNAEGVYNRKIESFNSTAGIYKKKLK